jgi:acetyl-CoA acetyltransferase
MQHDGLWEVTHKFPMGNCGEETAAKYNITREEQDAHAIQSYERATKAWQAGQFDKEIAPVVIKDRRVCVYLSGIWPLCPDPASDSLIHFRSLSSI